MTPRGGTSAARDKGQALTHGYHDGTADATGWRARIPTFSTGAPAVASAAFLIGGLIVAAFGGSAG